MVAGSGGSSAGAGGDPASTTPGIETMALNERRTILSTMCGVVSEHTGRMCTRSLRCPQHSDVQRKGLLTEITLTDGVWFHIRLETKSSRISYPKLTVKYDTT